MPQPPAAPASPLWEELRTLLRYALQIFGEPAAIYEDLVLPRRDALLLRRWLATLETIARALLTAMAARLPPPLRPQRAAPRRDRTSPAATAATETPSGAVDDPAEGDPDVTGADDPSTSDLPDSARWTGVVFRIAPRRRTSPRGAYAPERSFLSARSLARRFEALLRVAIAPEPYARRLARRLATEPGVVSRALRRPVSRGRPPLYEEIVEAALGEARDALGQPALETG